MDGQFVEGKVAVITGASRGLGRAVALALGEAGAKLALVARNQEKLAETQKLAREKGANAETFVTDVRYEAQVGKLEQDVIARFGTAHIVVNNAGTTVRKPLTDLSLDEWRLVIDTNLTGAFLVSRAFVPRLKAQKWGRIIYITSTMAHVGSVGRSVYCASESGLLGSVPWMLVSSASVSPSPSVSVTTGPEPPPPPPPPPQPMKARAASEIRAERSRILSAGVLTFASSRS